jgi:hypothetical protein
VAARPHISLEDDLGGDVDVDCAPVLAPSAADGESELRDLDGPDDIAFISGRA